MQIFVNPNFNFVKWRLYWFAFSILFIAVGAVLFFKNGIPLGIDFSGGASITLRFTSQPPLGQLRSSLPDATIQQYGAANQNSVLIRLPQLHREGDYAGNIVNQIHQQLNPESASKHDLNFYGTDRLANLFEKADPDAKGTTTDAAKYYTQLAERIIAKRSEVGIFTNMSQVTSVPGVTARDSQVLSQQAFLGRFNVLNQETVGPQVGRELQQKAFWAVILSAIAMGIYISLRFDLMFGVSAVACIVHDVLTSLAFLLMMRLEFSLNVVAALLTIVGYSINDTVVMYDRVRENRKKIKKQMPLAEELNLAMNQTLSRTILTSGTVFLVLVALIAFGGNVIRGFAWILMIGVVSGTYSTISIVPAVALWWDQLTGKKKPAVATSPLRADNVQREQTQPSRKRKAS